jgi:CHASE2 domain-containing sensor protein
MLFRSGLSVRNKIAPMKALLISRVTTLAAVTFLGERQTPIFVFLRRLEYDSLDTRFRYRPTNATPVDPPVVIVDIDQHAQEVLQEFLEKRRKDGPSRAYAWRCQEYIVAAPPADWDGVLVMTHK